MHPIYYYAATIHRTKLSTRKRLPLGYGLVAAKRQGGCTDL